MPRVHAVITAVVLAVVGRGIASGAAPAPPPVVFEGFGFGDLSAATSVARALRAASPAAAGTALPLDVLVRGPGGGAEVTAPLSAEVRGLVDRFDVAAGFQGDAQALVERSPRWTGRIGVGDSGPDGKRSLELRTRLESRAGASRVGLELGPRFERRLPNGTRLFLDGAASAEAVRAAADAGWQLPGTSTADSLTAVGVSARTGIVR